MKLIMLPSFEIINFLTTVTEEEYQQANRITLELRNGHSIIMDSSNGYKLIKDSEIVLEFSKFNVLFMGANQLFLALFNLSSSSPKKPKKMTTVPYNDNCIICFEKCKKGYILEGCQCAYGCHKKCLQKWRKNETTCPICRT